MCGMDNFSSTPRSINLGILGMGAIGRLMAWHCQTATHCYALHNHSAEDCSFNVRSDKSVEQVTIPHWNGEPLDVLFVCVKAQQTLAALEQWQAAITDNTQIVLLQNGLGQQQEVAQNYPKHTIFAASSTEGANRTQSGDLNYAGKGETLWGHFSGPGASLHLPLSNLGGSHKAVHNIHQVLLDKLAINAVINPLTVKYDCPNGKLLTIPAAFQELQQLVQEVESVIKQTEQKLSYPLQEKAEQVCTNTAANISSMLQDIRAGRNTEINYITGYLCNMAKAHHIDHELNQSLLNYVLIRQQTNH